MEYTLVYLNFSPFYVVFLLTCDASNAEMALGNVAEAEVDFESWCLTLFARAILKERLLLLTLLSYSGLGPILRVPIRPNPLDPHLQLEHQADLRLTIANPATARKLEVSSTSLLTASLSIILAPHLRLHSRSWPAISGTTVSAADSLRPATAMTFQLRPHLRLHMTIVSGRCES
ncbi:hypothetical protein V8G54_037407 [Vigna mungo]|uniref:Uncharacterized protein n=1 Tax=Vigna mungo TaxID=3915 RepID=A0AAQ3RE14_VIGMU